MDRKIVGVIPARYKSSRFEGKPLADIHGKPMVWWVYQRAKQVKELSEVYVATESDRVADVCKSLDIPCVITADTHPTGTDRVAEVAQKIAADIYLIWMGDEPLVAPADVSRLLAEFSSEDDLWCGMLATSFHDPVDVVNTTTIKLAVNDSNELLFMSRSAIPFPKEALAFSYLKNIGSYAMTKDALDFFLRTPPQNLERAEGIELLRLLENRKRVKTVLVESDSMSVDTPKDLERVAKLLTA